MNARQKLAISCFIEATRELRESGVIRSHRYLGDLGEFLCADTFGIDLAKNLREVGHDGLRKSLKVQIKYNGGSKTNIDLGDPNEYDEVYVILGKESAARPIIHDADYLVYLLSSEEVRGLRTSSGGYSCGKGGLPSKPARVIYLENNGTA